MNQTVKEMLKILGYITVSIISMIFFFNLMFSSSEWGIPEDTLELLFISYMIVSSLIIAVSYRFRYLKPFKIIKNILLFINITILIILAILWGLADKINFVIG